MANNYVFGLFDRPLAAKLKAEIDSALAAEFGSNVVTMSFSGSPKEIHHASLSAPQSWSEGENIEKVRKAIEITRSVIASHKKA
jgi:hypothetical protein